jgi:hypothetical protein
MKIKPSDRRNQIKTTRTAGAHREVEEEHKNPKKDAARRTRRITTPAKCFEQALAERSEMRAPHRSNRRKGKVKIVCPL